MKRKIIISALAALILTPVAPLVPEAPAESPAVFVVGGNGFLGVDSRGEVHYLITSDGFRYYDAPSYGYCPRHHHHHHCRYVPPGHDKQHKYYKKHAKKMKKHAKKMHKQARKHHYKHH